METIHLHLDSLEKTELFGLALGSMAKPGEVICLDGELGTGKTTLTQSIAKGLDIPQEYYVNSPSFNIFHEYPGRIPLYHMDFYRLGSDDDVLEMGLDEYFYMDGLTVIEWAEKAVNILPEKRLAIHLTTTGHQSRRVLCKIFHSIWSTRLPKIVENISNNDS